MPLLSDSVDPRSVSTLLCDGDGTLFPSEQPAFEASVTVTHRCLAMLGIPQRFTATQLRRATTGKNFRTTLTQIAQSHGVAVDREPFTTQLEAWVAEESAVVSHHLAEVLGPEQSVQNPLRRLAQRYQLALVTSSSLERAGASLHSSRLADLFDPDRRFSAQDSLPRATSKPDPAIYRHAGQRLRVTPETAWAVEDGPIGAQSAIAAGFPTIGLVCFVPEDERAEVSSRLTEVGVVAIARSWLEIEQILGARELLTVERA